MQFLYDASIRFQTNFSHSQFHASNSNFKLKLKLKLEINENFRSVPLKTSSTAYIEWVLAINCVRATLFVKLNYLICLLTWILGESFSIRSMFSEQILLFEQMSKWDCSWNAWCLKGKFPTNSYGQNWNCTDFVGILCIGHTPNYTRTERKKTHLRINVSI